MHDSQDIRQRMTAAAARIRRLKRVDRAAVAFITIGGVAVIVGVIGILVFIGWEAAPLFRAARVSPDGALALPTAVAQDRDARGGLRAIGTDEYLTYLYTVEPPGRIVIWRYDSGTEAQSHALFGDEPVLVTATSRSLLGDYVAAATEDGRVALAQVRFQPVFEDQARSGVEVEVRDRGLVALDSAGRTIREVSYGEADGLKAVAGIVADDEILVWWTDAGGEERRASLRPAAGEIFTRLRLGHIDQVAAGTDRGQIYHWRLEDGGPVLTDVSRVGAAPITALTYALGDNTVIVGDAAGDISGWFRARLHEHDEHQPMVRVHAFANQGAPVRSLAASPRDKSFVSTGDDGSIVLRHLTSQRTLVELPDQAAAATGAVLTPKSDAVLVALANGTIARFGVDNPHPESTLQTLFGRVWYEGYPRPDYVWQSTGATDDFEPKMSLVPLVFGTVKATLYALLFAMPLAVLGALYTSQFAHPDFRAKIKPTVEIMAALPSVVIGFIAGLWLASMVERHLVAVLLALPCAVTAGTCGLVLWNALPRSWIAGRRAGGELALILPLLLAGGWIALRIAPWIEATLFAGDLRLWLNGVGLTYDQRNSIVVGLAMGFAVIPIIFTISDDAFQAVPSSLTAASLALGASRWQTAIRIVVPTASPGVFSAIMVGFGRAIGETMIVLMATGNTPVLDWSIFNGMRTLSANIAVEIPEAPLGGTLYRVLFLSAALLFVMTFLINTVAELIRQRLRDKYKAV
jgi:phosphate transport system permease protein